MGIDLEVQVLPELCEQPRGASDELMLVESFR
jgi:hypothetical protein